MTMHLTTGLASARRSSWISVADSSGLSALRCSGLLSVRVAMRLSMDTFSELFTCHLRLIASVPHLCPAVVQHHQVALRDPGAKADDVPVAPEVGHDGLTGIDRRR